MDWYCWLFLVVMLFAFNEPDDPDDTNDGFFPEP